MTRPLQWSAPLWPSPTQVVQPEAFVKISEQVGAIDPAGAIWRANTEEQVAPSHTWPRPGGPAPGTATASAVRPMPSPGGSVPGAAVLAAVPVASPGGSVPGAVTSSAAVPMEVDQGSAPQTLSVKRGFLRIRTAAVYQNYRHADLLLHAGQVEQRLFMETTQDGRDPLVRDQILAAPAMRHLRLNAKQLIRRQLPQRPGGSFFRVVITSFAGRHRSVALAEALAEDCAEFAETTVEHMAVHRWDSTYMPVPMDPSPPPANQLVLFAETRSAI